MLAVLSVRQNISKSVPAVQLKNADRSSMHSAICVSWETVNFVLPLPRCAHCAPQKPTVRGQLLPVQVIGVVIESSSRTGVWPAPPPAHSPVA